VSWGTALAAYGAVNSASAQQSAAAANKGYLSQEGQISSAVAQRDEASIRQKSAISAGNLTAAAAQAGISTGASTQAVGRQSAINQELDALNARYGGVVRTNLYNTQAVNVGNAGNTAAMGSYLRAGGALLSGIGSGYNGNYSLASYADT
jgi:hypothetical protein